MPHVFQISGEEIGIIGGKTLNLKKENNLYMTSLLVQKNETHLKAFKIN